MTKLQKRVTGHREPASQGLFPFDDGKGPLMSTHLQGGVISAFPAMKAAPDLLSVKSFGRICMFFRISH